MRRKIAAGRHLVEVTAEFDASDTKFARAARSLLGDKAWSVLPRFTRSAGAAATNEDAPTGGGEGGGVVA